MNEKQATYIAGVNEMDLSYTRGQKRSFWDPWFDVGFTTKDMRMAWTQGRTNGFELGLRYVFERDEDNILIENIGDRWYFVDKPGNQPGRVYRDFDTMQQAVDTARSHGKTVIILPPDNGEIV